MAPAGGTQTRSMLAQAGRAARRSAARSAAARCARQRAARQRVQGYEVLSSSAVLSRGFSLKKRRGDSYAACPQPARAATARRGAVKRSHLSTTDPTHCAPDVFRRHLRTDRESSSACSSRTGEIERQPRRQRDEMRRAALQLRRAQVHLRKVRMTPAAARRSR